MFCFLAASGQPSQESSRLGEKKSSFYLAPILGLFDSHNNLSPYFHLTDGKTEAQRA